VVDLNALLGRSNDLEAVRENAFPREQLRPHGWLGFLITIACAGLTVITLYMAFRVTFGPIPTRALHLAVAIPMTFLLYPALKRWQGRGPSVLDYILAVLAFAAFAWAIYSAERFELRDAYYDPVETLDLVLGVTAILVVFEASRRTVGLTIVVLNLVFMAYAITGPVWPGLLAHKGTNFMRLIEHTYMLSDGLFNFIMGIMATFLFTFLTFGALLRVSGGDRVFTDFALALAGHRRGGPAKVAVISSALMGTLSGSTVSNVATTGAMTIPMMKKTGFRPFEAAAIETTASLGGALMPPLMGAGVFVMAAFTGIPLITIIGYSTIPAILYFVSIYFYVDVKARKKNLRGLPRAELPSLREVLRRGGHIFIPVIVLIILLLMDFTPFYASSACAIMTIVVSWLRKETRLTPRKLIIALEASTRVALTISALSASAAIIYGVITVTGLLVKVTSIILALSGGSLLVAIIFIALMSYVLGMGLPVTASYVLIAALGVAALGELGLPVLAAHLIIFWFSQDSTITPPICMTAFVAARIAEAPPMRTGWECVLIAKALYIIPFVFAYGSLLSESIPEILFDAAALCGTFALMPIIVEGHFARPITAPERAVLFAAAVGYFIASMGPMAESWVWLCGATAVAALGVILIRRGAEEAVPP
jgi:TRAP transporter 4TM/12TM fusion protein